jgi:hypothetical protein
MEPWRPRASTSNARPHPFRRAFLTTSAQVPAPPPYIYPCLREWAGRVICDPGLIAAPTRSSTPVVPAASIFVGFSSQGGRHAWPSRLSDPVSGAATYPIRGFSAQEAWCVAGNTCPPRGLPMNWSISHAQSIVVARRCRGCVRRPGSLAGRRLGREQSDAGMQRPAGRGSRIPRSARMPGPGVSRCRRVCCRRR